MVSRMSYEVERVKVKNLYLNDKVGAKSYPNLTISGCLKNKWNLAQDRKDLTNFKKKNRNFVVSF